jgi:hypothetical protein
VEGGGGARRLGWRGIADAAVKGQQGVEEGAKEEEEEEEEGQYLTGKSEGCKCAVG